MYEFIRIQFVLGRITAFDVLGMASKYITTDQAETIINGGKTADN